MLKLRKHNRFNREYKNALKQKGNTEAQFLTVLNYLVNEKPLPQKYKDHALSNNWAGFRECHIRPDWLLIYKVEKDILTLTLMRTGTHSDLF